MSKYLGISAFHRDAAAALIVDGIVVAAVQEERFSGKPGEPAFPRRAARWCLDHGGVRAQDLDGIVVSQKPLKTFERVLASHLIEFPRSAGGFSRAMFLWLGDRLWMKGRVAQELEVPTEKVLFCEHLVAHAVSAVFAAGLDRAAALVLDDLGEWATTGLYSVEGAEATTLVELKFPDSLGLVASAMTQYLGFVPGQDEEVLGALGTHGSPSHVDALRRFLSEEEHGAFHVDRGAFPFRRGGTRTFGAPLEEALGAARESGQTLHYQGANRRHADIAASAHALLTERAVHAAQELRRRLPEQPNLVVAGFLAQDPRLIAAIAESAGFDHVAVAPYADDAGSALGAAVIAAGRAAGPSMEDAPMARTAAERVHLGPAAEDVLGAHEGATSLSGEDAAAAEVARRLAGGELVGWARGPLALGHRSLGGRSALVTATEPGARARLLGALQLSEPWRECTLVMSMDDAEEMFVLPESARAAVQSGACSVVARPDARERLGDAIAPDGRARLSVIDRGHDAEGAAMLKACADAGHPVLLQTDLRRRGETIARQEADVLELLGRSGLDAVVVGARVYERASVSLEAR